MQARQAVARESAEAFYMCSWEVHIVSLPHWRFQFSPRPAGSACRSTLLPTGFPSFCSPMTFQQSVILQSWLWYFITWPACNVWTRADVPSSSTVQLPSSSLWRSAFALWLLVCPFGMAHIHFFHNKRKLIPFLIVKFQRPWPARGHHQLLSHSLWDITFSLF